VLGVPEGISELTRHRFWLQGACPQRFIEVAAQPLPYLVLPSIKQMGVLDFSAPATYPPFQVAPEASVVYVLLLAAYYPCGEGYHPSRPHIEPSTVVADWSGRAWALS
jgi:hypothetical protein